MTEPYTRSLFYLSVIGGLAEILAIKNTLKKQFFKSFNLSEQFN
ncbi:hypothetical protein VVMO6_00489 [Vibrio vulnificus MO6-24/O]|nr:hypothetical protein VVMO6_00489 [Vibrio vulnificus MO6-24/O]